MQETTERYTVGVLATRHIWVGVVQNNRVVDSLQVYPEPGHGSGGFQTKPVEAIADLIQRQVGRAAGDKRISAVGIGFPGIIREGVVEECPNLPQMKGVNLRGLLESSVPVRICNDTDAMAAGIAATRDQLERLIRVWNLSDGVGFGHYPKGDGIWEAGHSVVSLDPKERFCSCGGQGHLEGITGYRAMRLRFLDMEPEEVFASAKAGDPRCSDFVKLWHRALAAASATSIHLEGPGKFYLVGPNAEFVEPGLLNLHLNEMVTMSSMQGSSFEVVENTHEVAVIGAAVNAERALFDD